MSPGRENSLRIRGLLSFFLLVLILQRAPAVGGEPSAAASGTRVKLSVGTLFIPQGVKAGADGMEVLIHLKGDGPSAERNFTESARPGVLVWFWDPGLSKVYSTQFAGGKALQTMLDEVTAQLKQRELGDGTLKRVTVASFSAGFGALREILKNEALFKRVDALVLSDTIYAGFVGDAVQRKVNPADMEPFVKYAREAVDGRKTMILAHSSQPVPNYASTTEAASYLLDELKLTRTPADEDWGDGLRLINSAEKGAFKLFAFGPSDAKAHGLFLKHIGKFYKRLP